MRKFENAKICVRRVLADGFLIHINALKIRKQCWFLANNSWQEEIAPAQWKIQRLHSRLVHVIPEKFENTALFQRARPTSTQIRRCFS